MRNRGDLFFTSVSITNYKDGGLRRAQGRSLGTWIFMRRSAGPLWNCRCASLRAILIREIHYNTRSVRARGFPEEKDGWPLRGIKLVRRKKKGERKRDRGRGGGRNLRKIFCRGPRFRATHDNYANGDAMLKTPISLIRRRPPSFLLSFFSLPSPGKLVQPWRWKHGYLRLWLTLLWMCRRIEATAVS